MRGTDATVLALSGLAALTTARELQIDDVPVECATICGPIVELTFKCDVDNSFDELRRKLKRRKIEEEPRREARLLAPRRHHRRPNENNEAEATPTPPLDAATPSNEAEIQQPQQEVPQPAQDVQASPDASPVFIATLPLAASQPDQQATPQDTPTPTPTPSMETTPQPPPEAQQTPSAPPEVPPPAPPAAVSMPPLFAPIFAQPTSTITLTLAAPSVPPFPQLLPPLVVPVPAPMFPGLQPPPQQSAESTSSPQPPSQPTPQPPPQQPPRPPIQQQPPPALQPQVPRPSSSSSSTLQIRPPPAAATPPPQASSSAPAAMPNVGGGSPEKQPDKQGEDKENAEKSCICGNKSFDVQLLAGMCQSCIRQSGNRANDMDFIMSQCNFSESKYTRDKDDLVYNIRVVAQKPMLDRSANAMGDAGRLPAGFAAAVAVAVSFVAGVALLL